MNNSVIFSMPSLHRYCRLFGLAFAAVLTPGVVLSQQVPSAATRLNELGPENSRLAQRVGTWDVVETVWATPESVPISNKFIAERTMVGPFLQEIIRPAADSAGTDFRRIYYLSFNRVEGRWKYVSLDTRNPVGLMPAASFGPSENGSIILLFEPFAIAGSGTDVAGQMLRMDETMTQQDANHDRAEERFRMADGTGSMWLAYRYEYARRHPTEGSSFSGDHLSGVRAARGPGAYPPRPSASRSWPDSAIGRKDEMSPSRESN